MPVSFIHSIFGIVALTTSTHRTEDPASVLQFNRVQTLGSGGINSMRSPTRFCPVSVFAFVPKVRLKRRENFSPAFKLHQSYPD